MTSLSGIGKTIVCIIALRIEKNVLLDESINALAAEQFSMSNIKRLKELCKCIYRDDILKSGQINGDMYSPNVKVDISVWISSLRNFIEIKD